MASRPLLTNDLEKGMIVYFIFFNANKFEKSVTSNIQDHCCKKSLKIPKGVTRIRKHNTMVNRKRTK